MKEALSSSETSILTRAKRRKIPEGTILHSHRREKPQILQDINSSLVSLYATQLPSLHGKTFCRNPSCELCAAYSQNIMSEGTAISKVWASNFTR
jgi:hypothetical protein